MLREAEAIGAANGPGAHEPPANVRLGPICRGAPIFEGQVERRRSRRTGWLLCVAQDGGSPAWWSGRAAEQQLALAVAQPRAPPAEVSSQLVVVQPNGGVSANQLQPVVGVPAPGAKRPRRGGAPTSDNLYSGLIARELNRVFQAAVLWTRRSTRSRVGLCLRTPEAILVKRPAARLRA